MLNIKTVSFLALAGTAIAAPQGWGNWAGNYFNGGRGGDNDNAPAAHTEVAVVTAYTTVTAAGNWGGKNNNNGGQFYGRPVETPAPQPAAPAAPAPEKEAPSAPVASSGGDGYMGTVSEWRSKMGMSALSEDSKLVANALKTAQDGNGQMVHQLNPGSMAQVLAPGSAGDFVKVFVGGWLCERPNLPGLDGICASMSKGWAYDGQTGHADILSSKSYSKIGCANAGGIWSCDLA